MSFPQFAFNNVRRNARAYMAFFLSSAFMVMIFFSYSVFIYHPGVAAIEMGTNSAAGMKIASYIVFIFAFFFVLYSISAFLKLRNLEFGILMMLGARPGQINKLILLENMLIGLLSIIGGTSAGMLLSKLFLLLSTTIMGIDDLPFYWPVKALIFTSVSFILLFLVISIFTLFFIRKNQVLELLKGSIKPKKEPKVSLLLSLIGVALLTTGALVIRQPLSPVTLLVAAVTGIAGTYFFYSQLSVLGVRLLKLNRKRLWRGTNLLWISEMGYKIKDNARMLFLVTVVTSLACMASGFLLSINQANRTLYLQSPFALSYTVYHGANAEEGLGTIRSTLQEARVEYTENELKLLRATLKAENSKEVDGLDMLSVSRFNQLAPQMNLSVVNNLSDRDGVLLLNRQQPTEKYAEGETVLLLDQESTDLNSRKLEIQEIMSPETMPLGEYANSLLIVSDEVFQRKSAMVKPNEFRTEYLYKIPAWDSSLPETGEAETVVSNKLSDWSIDKNMTEDNWDTHLSARATQYMSTKQGSAMLSFIGIFIALIFSLSSASFLYFKLHTELNADMRMYHALSKIGLSVKEMSAAATRQIALLFYIPILIATIQTLVVIRPVLGQIGITYVTVPVLITAAAFLIVQTVYFVVARSRYIHNLKKMMV